VKTTVTSALGLSLSAICHACGAAPAALPAVAPSSAPTPAATQAPPRETVSQVGLRLGWPIWIGIVCDDLQAQRRFYRDVLGLTESNVQAGSIWFELDGRLLELFAKSQRPQYAERGVAFGFAVPDIQSARATLLERGVQPVSEIEGVSDARWAYFRDAEGNLFELVQRP
jgi:predicted enzyme related to lactoylglutathione lyase